MHRPAVCIASENVLANRTWLPCSSCSHCLPKTFWQTHGVYVMHSVYWTHCSLQHSCMQTPGRIFLSLCSQRKANIKMKFKTAEGKNCETCEKSAKRWYKTWHTNTYIDRGRRNNHFRWQEMKVSVRVRKYWCCFLFVWVSLWVCVTYVLCQMVYEVAVHFFTPFYCLFLLIRLMGNFCLVKRKVWANTNKKRGTNYVEGILEIELQRFLRLLVSLGRMRDICRTFVIPVGTTTLSAIPHIWKDINDICTPWHN